MLKINSEETKEKREIHINLDRNPGINCNIEQQWQLPLT